MPTPWEAHVQKIGQLTVFPGPNMVREPAWGMGLFERIRLEFNRLAQVNLLGVRLVVSNQAPNPNGTGANVQFEVSNGSCPFFDGFGNPQTGNLDVSLGHIKGICFRIEGSGLGGFIFSKRAFVFVPANPKVSATRTVTENVRMAVALHELFHACGLSADDPGHGTPNLPAIGDLDLFASGGLVLPGSGTSQDQYLVGGHVVPDRSGQFSITARTASLVQRIWLLGRV
jgi:hypothetical protein